MTLDELSTTYKQVQPVTFNADTGEIVVNDIYMNRDRAQQAVSTTSSTSDMSDWKVGNSNTQNGYGWRVNFGKVSPVDPENYVTRKTQSSEDDNNKKDNMITQTLKRVGKWWEEANLLQYNIFSKDKLNKAKEWMGYFKNIGMSDVQSIALIGNVLAECNFNHQAVNQQELKGKSSNKDTHGWTGAGEGLVQFTTWDNKLPLIQQYNADRRRQGEEISTDPKEYSKDDARHISSVNKHDAALFIEYWYKDLMSKYGDSDFDSLMGAFYLRKAGNYSQKIKKGKQSVIEQAYNTGIYYNNYHNSQSYRQGKEKQQNNFVKALRFSYDLGRELGYFA